jgi:hypothetical protein
MPDLLTHIIIAQGWRKGLGYSLTSWFLVGTVLPDILTRPFNIIFPSLFWFFMPLHTPVGLFLVCAFISRFFQPEKQNPVLYNLLGGSALHLLLDLFQKHIGSGYHLLFPFSWSSFEIGLIWPETSLYLLPLWLAMGAFFAGRWLLRTKWWRNGSLEGQKRKSMTRW